MKKYMLAAAVLASLASPSLAFSYKVMSLEDFKLDKNSIEVGTRLELAGQLQQLGELGMLKDGLMDMSPVMVELKGLPREQRKDLLHCALLCSVIIRGRVDKVFTGQGLVGEDLTVK